MPTLDQLGKLREALERDRAMLVRVVPDGTHWSLGVLDGHPPPQHLADAQLVLTKTATVRKGSRRDSTWYVTDLADKGAWREVVTHRASGKPIGYAGYPEALADYRID